MKKLIGLALAGALFAVVGCGGGSSEGNKGTTPAGNTAGDAAAPMAADGGAAPAPAPAQ